MKLLNRLFKSKIEKLEESGDVAGLRTMMTKGTPEQRVAAVEVVARIGGESVPVIMVEALRCEDPAVVDAAAEVLGRLGEEAAAELASALGGSHGDRARELLLGCGNGAAGALLQAAGAGDETARGRAIGGLLTLERESEDDELHEAVFRCLLATVGDRSPALRARAASLLSERNDPRAARALAAQLKDGDEKVRCACRDALASLGEAAVPELVFTLGDRNANARRMAAELLAERCSEATNLDLRREALAAVLRISSDRDDGVRAAARRALEGIPAKDVVDAELEKLADPECSDRDEVLELLHQLLASPAVSAGARQESVEHIRSLGFAFEE